MNSFIGSRAMGVFWLLVSAGAVGLLSFERVSGGDWSSLNQLTEAEAGAIVGARDKGMVGCGAIGTRLATVCETGDLLDKCASIWEGCLSCRTDCSAVASREPGGAPEWGQFASVHCGRHLNSTYTVNNCSWLCNCTGIVFSGPWGCPRQATAFLTCGVPN